MKMEDLRIGVLLSGRGSNAEAIYKACLNGKIDGKIVVVCSDNPASEGLQFFEKEKIATSLLDYAVPRKAEALSFLPADFNLKDVLSKQKLFKDEGHELINKLVNNYFQQRAIVEAKLFEKLRSYSCDLLVLAGFMKLLTPYFVDKFNADGEYRIMNIHPALLPSFPGTKGYEDTYNFGCKVGGCTVHFVDCGEDSGPIIGQKGYEIYPDDTLETIKKKGLANEWQLYPECIQLFAHGRLKVVEKNGRKIVEILPEK